MQPDEISMYLYLSDSHFNLLFEAIFYATSGAAKVGRGWVQNFNLLFEAIFYATILESIFPIINI